MTTVMSGINESESYLNPEKLPSIIYFQKDGNEGVRKVQLRRNELLKTFDLNRQNVNQEEFEKVLKEFIKKSQGTQSKK